jgi:hypothetical protein
MTDELIRCRFFATLKYGRGLSRLEQPRTIKQLLLKVFMYGYTECYSNFMEAQNGLEV